MKGPKFKGTGGQTEPAQNPKTVPQWKQDLEIDKYALEEECEMQASRFAKYALEHVRRLTQLEEMKLELDIERRETKLAKEVLYAGLDMKIRRSAENLNEKVTEATVKSRIAFDKDYQEKVKALDTGLDLKEKEFIKKKMEVESAASVREAFKQRKDMLGHLVFLWGADYYADPPTAERSVERMNEQLNMKGRRFKHAEKTVK